MNIAFPYIAQIHHIPHSIGIALDLSTRYPELHVAIIVPTAEHLAVVTAIATNYPHHRCEILQTSLPTYYELLCRLLRHRIFATLGMLFFNRTLFARFDALVVPERTSLLLKRLGLKSTRFIHTFHGAGDRQRGFERRIGQFDFLLIPGKKHADRLLQLGLARTGSYAITGYQKFGILPARNNTSTGLFREQRPTVLYNPHCNTKLGSWGSMGHGILEYFARSVDYNFIFAPHVKLFDHASPKTLREFDRYRDLPHMLIDLGSAASIDMTYTQAADLYLGDVSSQVYEFLFRPRPCLFLNSNHVQWQRDVNYFFWRCGHVIENVGALDAALANALPTHAHYLEAQRECFRYTFGELMHDAPKRASDEIVNFLTPREPAPASMTTRSTRAA